MNAYKPRTLGSPSEIQERMIEECGKSPKELAVFVNRRLGTVYGWSDPEASDGVPFNTLCQLVQKYRTTAPIHYLAALAGGIFLPLPEGEDHLVDLSSDFALEAGEAVAEIIAARSPRSLGGVDLTEEERQRIRLRLHDVMRVMGSLLAELNGDHFGDAPEARP